MDPIFPSFRERINTLRYQHGIVMCGQKLLHLIMTTLIIGNINDIKAVLLEKLGSNNQYKNSFTKDEHQLLNEGQHKTWDISLLFKIIQKVCGLDPAGNSWTQPIDGRDTLEYLVTTIKEIRNKLVHSFGLVITEAQMDTKFTELTDIALKMIQALGDRAQVLGKQLTDVEANITMEEVFAMVAEVKEPINEGSSGAVPESVCSASSKVSKNIRNNDDEDDFYESDKLQTDTPQTLAYDNAYVAAAACAAAGGEAPLELTWEEQIHQDLTQKFWQCAGLE